MILSKVLIPKKKKHGPFLGPTSFIRINFVFWVPDFDGY